MRRLNRRRLRCRQGDAAMKSERTAFQPKALFYAGTAVCFCVSLFMLLQTRGAALDGLIFGGGSDRFMDFFNHIAYVEHRTTLYQTSPHACFPPLAYVMYYLLGRLLPPGSIAMQAASSTSSYALLLYVIYSAFFTLLLFYLTRKLLASFSIEQCLLVAGIIFFSNIYLFNVLERGNSVLVVTILLMAALALRNSKRWYFRELALILIAAAAGFKIYPAVVGVLYIIEKRYREGVRLVLYGALFFFLPFLFFGGVPAFFQFLENQTLIQTSCSSGIGSIHALVGQLHRMFTGKTDGASGLSLLVTGVYAALALFSCFIQRGGWKTWMLLCSIMVIAPFWSGEYTCIYFVIPLLLFLKDAGSNRTKANYCYAAGFVVIFMLFSGDANWFHLHFSTSLSYFLRYVTIYVMNAAIIVGSIVSFGKTLHGKRRSAGAAAQT